MAEDRKISLALLAQWNGWHPAGWFTAGGDKDASNDVDYYVSMAKLAEKGKFDLFFLADTPAARTDHLEAWSRNPVYMNWFEPTTLLSAVAMMTARIGVAGTASTSFTEPYNIARTYASLDHISHGRAGWNVVTSGNNYAARNFGLEQLPPHAERYE
ncbi:MAG TPA: LLM class flavin-dependent oxidoreductase, partial [Paenirhodobacter sp.]